MTEWIDRMFTTKCIHWLLVPIDFQEFVLAISWPSCVLRPAIFFLMSCLASLRMFPVLCKQRIFFRHCDIFCQRYPTNSFSFVVHLWAFLSCRDYILFSCFCFVLLGFFSFSLLKLRSLLQTIWSIIVLHSRISWSKSRRPDILQPRTKEFCFAIVFASMVTMVKYS